jgi:hypothetical protein
MMKVKVELQTMNDVSQFVNITTQIAEPVYLVGNDFRVSAKSLLGALYTMEWEDVWCECERDIYTKIEKFVV